MNKLSQKILRCVAGASMAATALLSGCGGGDVDTHLYSQTNASSNTIVHMASRRDGALAVVDTISTGGAGTNSGPDPLTSQYSMITTPDRNTLFSVNGGDNSVSAFSIDPHDGHLTLLKANATTGALPVSLAYQRNTLYVLFQDSQTVQSYPVRKGILGPSSGSYSVANAVGKPTQILLSPEGQYLLVNAGTGSHTVDAFPVRPDGTLGTPVVNTGLVSSPFASVFLNPHTLLVTSAGGHALQSLRFKKGVLSVTAPPVPGDLMGAPCWLALTPDGRFAYAGNGGSGSISSYAVAGDGTLTLRQAQAASEGLAVAGDSVISANGKFLYSTYLAAGVVISYAIEQDGRLTRVGDPAVVTTSATMQGLAGA